MKLAERRKRVEWEERLVSEWAAEVHQLARVHMRVRVGELPPEAEAVAKMGISPYMYGVVRHWADAVVIYPDRVIVVEGKIKLSSVALGQIIVNTDLYGSTPEFRDTWDTQREGLLLYAFGDEVTERIAKNMGYKTERFCPAWAKKAYVDRMRRGHVRVR
ncbi:hypothetical protein ES708_13315 [subsurface metagenome]